MTEINWASYPLASDGSVRQWLACGPVPAPLTNLQAHVAAQGNPFGKGERWIMNYWAYEPESIQLKQRIYATLPPPALPDVQPILGQAAAGNQAWSYRTAAEDAMIDFSRFNFIPTLMQAWAYVALDSEQAATVSLEWLTIGPLHVWLNNQLVQQHTQAFSYVEPLRIESTLELKAGRNHVLVQGDMIGWREARLAIGLRLLNAEPLTVVIPLGAVEAAAWQHAEQALAQVLVKQYAFPHLPGYIELRASAVEPIEFEAEVSIPTEGGPWARFTDEFMPPLGTARYHLQPGQRAELPITDAVLGAMTTLPGENSLLLTLRPASAVPYAVEYPIWASENQFRLQPYGDYESRRREALKHLSRMSFDVLAALAAVEIGDKQVIDSAAIQVALNFLNNRFDCADFYAVSLLALLYRYGDSQALKTEDQAAIEDAFRNFKFWIDEPGLDAMCYFTENHQILFHVTAYLTGQRYPDWVFANSGRSGTEQQQRARSHIEAWILRRLQGGYSEWDSNAYLALDCYAMLALVEFADRTRLREMATTLLHKTFFMIAMQSYRGVHGGTHGRCYVEGLKTARMENTSALQRIGWGMGIFNGETRATGLLAMARRYRIPEVLQKIGADVSHTLITRARSTAEYQPQWDMQQGRWDVRTLTYRSPDGMLAAALDHRPGERGVQEHLWQATLSPEAVVFTNYPGNNQEHGQARPNFWAGSVRLPRVAMHERTVLCLYAIETDVGLGFSHAYFPTVFFDEYQIDEQWAFARVGAGYVALWSDGELSLTSGGPHAAQELRSHGSGKVWLCHLGRAALDGDFASFQNTLRQHAPQVQGTAIRWQTPDGAALAFAWEGALQVNGQAQSWDDFPLYDNSYTHTPIGAGTMCIEHEGEQLLLDLQQGKVIDS